MTCCKQGLNGVVVRKSGEYRKLGACESPSSSSCENGSMRFYPLASESQDGSRNKSRMTLKTMPKPAPSGLVRVNGRLRTFAEYAQLEVFPNRS